MRLKPGATALETWVQDKSLGGVDGIAIGPDGKAHDLFDGEAARKARGAVAEATRADEAERQMLLLKPLHLIFVLSWPLMIKEVVYLTPLPPPTVLLNVLCVRSSSNIIQRTAF